MNLLGKYRGDGNRQRVTDVRISRETGTPEELFKIDRVKASTLGLDVNTIANFLETSVAGVSSTNYREGGDEYKILVKMKDLINAVARDSRFAGDERVR